MLRNLVLMLSLVGFFYGCSSDDGDKKTPAGNTSNIPAELKSLATLTNNFTFSATSLFNDADLITVLSNPLAIEGNVIGVACTAGDAATIGTVAHEHIAATSTHKVKLTNVCFAGNIKINGAISVPVTTLQSAAMADGVTVDLTINVAGRTLEIIGAKFIITGTGGTGVTMSSVGKFAVTDNNVRYEVENLGVAVTTTEGGVNVAIEGTVIDPIHGAFVLAGALQGLSANGLPTGGAFTLTNATKNQVLAVTYTNGSYIVVFNDKPI